MCEGVIPSVHCFNALLEVYASSGSLDRASNMYDSLCSSGERPDQCTFRALFSTVSVYAIKGMLVIDIE